MLYSYHNTVHTDTGITPHQNLFRCTPIDLRAPFQTAALKLSTGCKRFENWLQALAVEFEKARISTEYVRQAMIRAHKKGVVSHPYKIGDQVKFLVSISSLVLCLLRDQSCSHNLWDHLRHFRASQARSLSFEVPS